MEICDSDRVVINTVKANYYKEIIAMIKTEEETGLTISERDEIKIKEAYAVMEKDPKSHYDFKVHTLDGKVLETDDLNALFNVYGIEKIECIKRKLKVQDFRDVFGYTYGKIEVHTVDLEEHENGSVTVLNYDEEFNGRELNQIPQNTPIMVQIHFKEGGWYELHDSYLMIIDEGQLKEYDRSLDQVTKPFFKPLEVSIIEEVYHPEVGEAEGQHHDQVECESFDELMTVFNTYYPYFTSSCTYHNGLWFITESTPNYRTGEYTQYTLHFNRPFTKNEFEDIRSEFALSCEWR